MLPLDDIRVLDLSGAIGQYATRLLADLGADVLRLEPPGGCDERRQPPFFQDRPHHETSLSFWYFNANKRSLTLNLGTADGRALFARLLERADVIVDGLPRGELARLGVDSAGWRERYPRLIWATISGFGSSGPHADFLATDLVGLAMSGVLTLAGYPDRPPTVLPGQQGYISASVHGAQGILLALLARDATGSGQGVEVSMQEALSLAQETAMQTYDLRGEVRERQGDARLLPGIGTYECADGFVYAMIGVRGFGAPWTVLAGWMDEQGMADDLAEERWQDLLANVNLRELTALQTDPERLAEMTARFRHVDDILRAFMLRHTKAELYEGGQQRRLLIGPVNSARDLVEDKQLRARGWFMRVEQPGVDVAITYPGPPFRLSELDWSIRRAAPRLGEHNREVYEGELGLTHEQLITLAGVGAI